MSTRAAEKCQTANGFQSQLPARGMLSYSDRIVLRIAGVCDTRTVCKRAATKSSNSVGDVTTAVSSVGAVSSDEAQVSLLRLVASNSRNDAAIARRKLFSGQNSVQTNATTNLFNTHDDDDNDNVENAVDFILQHRLRQLLIADTTDELDNQNLVATNTTNTTITNNNINNNNKGLKIVFI